MNYCFSRMHTWALIQNGRESRHVGSRAFTAATMMLAGVVLLAGVLTAQEKANAMRVPPQFNMQAQTTCETEMLRDTTVRLKIEENQLVNVFGEIGVFVDRLEGA